MSGKQFELAELDIRLHFLKNNNAVVLQTTKRLLKDTYLATSCFVCGAFRVNVDLKRCHC